MDTTRICPTCRASGASLVPLSVGAVTLCGTCSSPMMIVEGGARQLTDDEVRQHASIIKRKTRVLGLLLQLLGGGGALR